MLRWSPRKSLVLFSSLATLGSLLAACETAPPTAERRPQTRPAASGPAGMTTQPVTQPEATQPAAAEPEPPDYVTIVARFISSNRAAAEVQVEAGNRLVIDTHNVRRLHIDRDRVPLNRRRSISLQLDGQGLEWLAHSKVVEFERSMAGEWIPVKPAQHSQP
jgi:hypothetical protein